MLKSYLYSLLIAAILSVVAVLCIPKEYAAHVVLTDEVKESGMLLGIDSWSARFQELRSNEGLQNPEVYSKILDNNRLAKDGIRYSFSIKKQIITIEARDTDPLRAAQKVDSIKNLLDKTIADKRREIKEESMASAEQYLNESRLRYEKAYKEYAAYIDGHNSLVLEKYKAYQDTLRGEVAFSEDAYINAAKIYKRSEALANMPYPTFTVLKSAVVPTSPIYPNGFNIFLALSCIGIVLSTWYNLWKRKLTVLGDKAYILDICHLFSPWSINFIHWAIIMFLLYLLSGELLEPISRRFYISLSLWMIIFTITSILTFFVMCPANRNKENNSEFSFNSRIFNCFLIFSIILTPLHFYQIYKIAAMLDISELMYNIRQIAAFGDNNYGILNYALVINKALLVVALWQFPKIEKWKLFTLYILNITSTTALMDKGTFFFMIFFTLFIMFEKRVIKIRTIAISSIVIILLFFVFTLGREYRADSTDSEIMTFTDFFAIYLLASPAAYGHLFMDIPSQFGARTFETIYLFLDRFGFGPFEVHDKMMDFVWVPLPTNTYTIFQPFFQDFGQKGVAFFAMVYGVMFGTIYRLYKNGNSLCSGIYTYMAVALMLQFHQEELFLSLVHWIQFSFFVWLFTFDKIKVRFK